MKTLLIFIPVIMTLFILERLFSIDLTVSDFVYKNFGFNDRRTLVYITYLAPVVPVAWGIYVISSQSDRSKRVILEFILLIATAPVLTHILLKPVFQRPRPDDIQRYNEQSHRHFISAGTLGSKGNSFPSGHSTMAFTLIFLYFLSLNKSKIKRYRLLVPGILFGSFMGIIRILQGRHYCSDVLAAFTVVFICSFVLSVIFQKFLYKNEDVFGQENLKISE